MAKVGVYVCHCGSNIAGVIDVEAVRAFAETLPDVVIARKDLFMCSDSGQEQIKQDIRDGLVDRVVVAACTPRTHEPIFRAACEAGGLNKYLFEMANIRDQASWVHPHDPEGATEKAKLVVASAVGKAKFLQPLEDKFVNVTDAAMVVGGGQPIATNIETIKARTDCLNDEDKNLPLRKSHENPEISKIYGEFLSSPVSPLAHHLLHTEYVDRSSDIKE